MKHVPCYLHDAIKLHALPPYFVEACTGVDVFFNVIIIQKTIECLRNKSPVIVQRSKHLNFVL